MNLVRSYQQSDLYSSSCLASDYKKFYAVNFLEFSS